MTNEQWLAQKVLEQEQTIQQKDRMIDELRELLNGQTLEVAHMSQRITFLFQVLAKVSASVPLREVSADEFSITGYEQSVAQ